MSFKVTTTPAKTQATSPNEFFIQISEAQNEKNISLEVKVHPFLNFKICESEGLKFSFQNEKGNVFGVEILNSCLGEAFSNVSKELREVEAILGQFSPFQVAEKDVILNSRQQIHLISVMKNRLDTKAKRGAIVKALAVGSRYPHIPESFKQVAGALLDRIFDAGEDPATYEANLKALML